MSEKSEMTDVPNQTTNENDETPNEDDDYVQNAIAQCANLSLNSSNSSIVIESDSDNESSIAESAPSDNKDTVACNPHRQSTQIGHAIFQNSNGMSFGNTYYGPVTIIHNPPEKQADPPKKCENVERTADVLNRPVGVAEGERAPLRIVSRSEWFARPPERESNLLELPCVRVIIAHTATYEMATTQMECARLVRDFQTYHIESKGWDDIGYNFLVGGDGSIYVGRGWDYQGAHSRLFNPKSICIAFIGNFFKTLPPECSLTAAQELIKEGVRMGKLKEDYRLYGHRQLIPTISPGNRLYEHLQTWDHWSAEVLPP